MSTTSTTIQPDTGNDDSKMSSISLVTSPPSTKPSTAGESPAQATGTSGTSGAAAAIVGAAKQYPKWLPHQFASTVGRRLFLLFVFAALAPVALMAALSFQQVSDVLREARDRELVQSARTFGLGVLERLRWTDSLLGEAATVPTPLTRLAPRVGRELSGVAVLNRQGRLLQQIGELPVLTSFDPLSIDPASIPRRTALLTEVATDASAAVLVQPVAGAGEIGFIAAAISPAYLWGNRGADPERTVLCASATTGTTLFCSQPTPEKALLRLVVETPRGESTAQFDKDGAAVRAGAALIDTDQNFIGPRIVITAMQAESYLLRPAQAFRTMFVPIAAVSVLLVVLLSLNQVRRILVPLHRLLDGTRRVTDRNFATPVSVFEDDEFGQLAKAFNTMTKELGLHFRTLTAFSEIDRTILTTVDMRQVADIALSCIQEIAGVKVVSLALLEPDSPHRTQVYIRVGTGAMIREELVQALDLAGADASLRKWSKSIRLPSAYRAALRRHGATYMYLLPVARAERVWGVLVLGSDQSTALTADQAHSLAGVIDRLAVALSSVARDKQLHDQAHFDGLTGLPNRHYLMDMLSQQLTHARRDKHPLAVLYLDLDRFKRTNDILGHAAGDVMLRLSADRIRRTVRDIDIVARLGGDEFTVVLSKVKSGRDAGRVARALIAALNEPFDIDGHVMYAGASVGIALYPNDGETGAELLKKADTALYLAKDRGRGRHAFFEERMNVDASARATVDRELREALRRNEFRLHYQPQIDLETGEVCAVEALLRWQHPQRGLLAPAAFIEQAEENGLIESIGSWVLREACQQHRRWLDAGTVIPCVSVNVSAIQLRNISFAANVEAALNTSTTAAALPRTRGDRIAVPRRRPGRRRHPRALARNGRGDRGGRFRHRLFVIRLCQAAACCRAETRPFIHRRCRRRSKRCHHRRRDHRDGPCAGQDRCCRRC